MKNLILFSAIVFLMASCSRQESFEEKIQGEWLTYSFVINCQDASLSTPLTMAEEDGCINLWGSTQCTSIKLATDGKAQFIYSYENDEEVTQDFTYTINEARESINICFESADCIEFTFAQNRLRQVMDEDGCLCEFEYDKRS